MTSFAKRPGGSPEVAERATSPFGSFLSHACHVFLQTLPEVAEWRNRCVISVGMKIIHSLCVSENSDELKADKNFLLRNLSSFYRGIELTILSLVHKSGIPSV